MSKELVKISPEGIEVANAYLEYGSIEEVCKTLDFPQQKVSEILNTREVKKFIDTIYLDTGYRNRNKIAGLLDTIIESKLEEAQESQIYSKKDLVDLIKLAHTMRMDELKHQNADTNIKSQTNVQINEGLPFGTGNYGKLVEELLHGGT